MLSKLFISKVRIKMLNQFLMDPQQEYHVRGLVRILEEEINAVRRELQNLESAGILISKRKGNKLFYQLDENCRYVVDLTRLMYQVRDHVVAIHTAVSRVSNIQMALITGNYLKNSYDHDYDIDMLILGEVDVNELTVAIKKIEEKLGKELRVTVLHQKDLEFSYKKRDDFLLNILRGDKIFLIGSDKDLI